MKALVYRGPGKRTYEDRPRPAIKVSTDAIVRVTNATICGTDLRAMGGDMPRIARGRILGNEGTGIIERVGDRVANFEVGNFVLISCLTSCGTCAQCQQGQPMSCLNGGWILGSRIDGTYADYVRVPFADHSLISIADAADGTSEGPWIDNFPEGFKRGVVQGPDEPADTAAVVFGGSVGMGPLLTVMQYYRTVVHPILGTNAGHLPTARGPEIRNRRKPLHRQLLHHFAPTKTR